MVTKKKNDFVPPEKKAEKVKKLEIRMQAQRVDWDRNEDKKAPPDGEFPCTKCGSKKTTSFE